MSQETEHKQQVNTFRKEFIPISAIEIRFEDRLYVSKDAPEQDPFIVSLATSIKRHGLINPITVRELPDGKYEKLAGYCRILAHKLLGLTEIESYILPANTSDIHAYSITLDENIKRKNLDTISLSEAYLKLLGIHLITECKLPMGDEYKARPQGFLVQTGKDGFYTYANVVRKREEGGDSLKSISVMASKTHRIVEDFLENIGMSASGFKKRILMLNYDEFIKQLLHSNYINATVAKKLHTLKNSSEDMYRSVQAEVNAVIVSIDDGETEFDDGQEQVISICTKYEDINKHGSVERANKIQKFKKRLDAIFSKMTSDNVSEETRKEIFKKIKEIEEVLQQ